MKYQSSSTHKVKVLKKMGQPPRSRSQSKKKGYPRKGLITGNIKALALTGQKLLATLKFLKSFREEDRNTE